MKIVRKQLKPFKGEYKRDYILLWVEEDWEVKGVPFGFSPRPYTRGVTKREIVSIHDFFMQHKERDFQRFNRESKLKQEEKGGK